MPYCCPKCNTVIRTGEKDAKAHYKKCGVPWSSENPFPSKTKKKGRAKKIGRGRKKSSRRR